MSVGRGKIADDFSGESASVFFKLCDCTNDIQKMVNIQNGLNRFISKAEKMSTDLRTPFRSIFFCIFPRNELFWSDYVFFFFKFVVVAFIFADFVKYSYRLRLVFARFIYTILLVSSTPWHPSPVIGAARGWCAMTISSKSSDNPPPDDYPRSK